MRLPNISNTLTINVFVLFGIYLMQSNSNTSAEQATPSTNVDVEVLTTMNNDYLLAYTQGDADWFDEHLSSDFTENSPDSTMLNKSEFLNKIAGIAVLEVAGIVAEELSVRVLGDLAIVHAIPVRQLEDGTVIKGGRYTDIYYKTNGVWLCVSAHLGGSSN